MSLPRQGSKENVQELEMKEKVAQLEEKKAALEKRIEEDRIQKEEVEKRLAKEQEARQAAEAELQKSREKEEARKLRHEERKLKRKKTSESHKENIPLEDLKAKKGEKEEIEEVTEEKEEKEGTIKYQPLNQGGDLTASSGQKPNNEEEIKGEDEEELELTFPLRKSNHYGQWIAQEAHRGVVAFVGTLSINHYVQPYIPSPFGPMVTAGTFLVVDAAHVAMHALVKNQNPLRYLQAYGNSALDTAKGFGHEVGKFVGGLGIVSGTTYGLTQAVIHIGPMINPMSNLVKAFNYAANNPLINTAVVGFSAWLLNGGLKWGYERFKPMPKIGPEEDPHLQYLQSTLYHLGLRVGKDLAAFEAFKFAMTSFGAAALLNRPEALLFALAFDQLLSEPTRHLGHTHKPIESLVTRSETNAEGYTRLTQDEEEAQKDYDEEEDLTKKGPTKGQQTLATGWYVGRAVTVLAVTYGTEKFAEWMGWKEKEKEMSPVEQTVWVIGITGGGILLERTLENVLPPVAKKIAEGGAYVVGSLARCGSSMWNNRPSCPTWGRNNLVEEQAQERQQMMRQSK